MFCVTVLPSGDQICELWHESGHQMGAHTVPIVAAYNKLDRSLL